MSLLSSYQEVISDPYSGTGDATTANRKRAAAIDEKSSQSSSLLDAFNETVGADQAPSRPSAMPASTESKQPVSALGDYSAGEFAGDVGKKVTGSAISGTASMPLGIQEAAKGSLRSSVSLRPRRTAFDVVSDAINPIGAAQTAAKLAASWMMDASGFKSFADQQADDQSRIIALDKVTSGIKIPGAQGLADFGYSVQKDIENTISEEGKKRVAGSNVTGNLFKGEIDFGTDPTLSGYSLQAAGVLGSLAPVVATAALTKSPTAAMAVGGSQAAGEAANTAQQYIDNLTDDQLKEVSPYYSVLLSNGVAADEARQIVTDKAAESGALLQGMVAALGSRVTGKLVTGAYDHILRKVGNKLGGAAVAGTVFGAAEEGVQEVTEGVASDIGIRSQISNKEIGQDSAANFVLGALGGAPVGTVSGAMSTPARVAANQLREGVDASTTNQSVVDKYIRRALDPNRETALDPTMSETPSESQLGEKVLPSREERAAAAGTQQQQTAVDAVSTAVRGGISEDGADQEQVQAQNMSQQDQVPPPQNSSVNNAVSDVLAQSEQELLASTDAQKSNSETAVPAIPETLTAALNNMRSDLGLSEQESLNATEVTNNTRLNRFSKALNTAFGVNVHWMDFGDQLTTQSGQSFGAFNGYRSKDTILLAPNADFLDTTWHELTHVLETRYPDVYRALQQTIVPNMDAAQRQDLIASLNQRRQSEVGRDMLPAAMESELTAYAVGEVGQSPETLGQMFDSFSDPTLAKQFRDVLMDVLNKLLGYVRGPQYIKERQALTKAQKAVVSAFAEFQRRETQKQMGVQPAASPAVATAQQGQPQATQTFAPVTPVNPVQTAPTAVTQPSATTAPATTAATTAAPGTAPSTEPGSFARGFTEQQVAAKIMSGEKVSKALLIRYPQINAAYSGVQALIRRAPTIKAQFDEQMREFAKQNGVTLRAGPIKTTNRAFAKVWVDYEGNFNKLGDSVRSTIVAADVTQYEDLIQKILAMYPGAVLKRNGYAPNAPQDSTGYRDVFFKGITIDGFPVELQLNHPQMIDAKQSSHQMYEDASLLARRIKSDQTLSPADIESLGRQVEELESKMFSVYNNVYLGIVDSTSLRNSGSVIATPSDVNVESVNTRRSPRSQAQMPVLTPVLQDVTGTSLTSKNVVRGGNESGNATTTSPSSVPDSNITQKASAPKETAPAETKPASQAALQPPPAGEPVSPLRDIVPEEEAAARINRRLSRKEGVGQPVNARVSLGTGSEQVVVGKITVEDWLSRAQTQLSESEFRDARQWYRSLEQTLTPLFGKDSPRYALAWLLSQKNESPTGGLRNVMRASDIASGKQEIKKAGLNQDAMVAVLQGRMPEGGIGAKLLDFLDSELGKNTRTVMRDDPRGKQPAAIDVHAQRDVGFIDETLMNYLRERFGQEAVAQLSVDKTTSGEAQYEYGIDFYNDVVDFLNERGVDGGGWTAREVQAVGWVSMQKTMGIRAEFVSDIVSGNTRRISIGLGPGGDSPLSGKMLAGAEIPVSIAQKEIAYLADLAGVKIRQSVAGVGAYLTSIEGSIQVDAIGSPEGFTDFMDMVGYAFQQTEMISTRPLKSGKNMAIDVMSPGLDSVESATSLFSKFLETVPKDKSGDPIAPGFQQVTIDGVPGIRLLNFGGKWRASQVEEIVAAVNGASASVGIDLEAVTVKTVSLDSRKNDWSKNTDGKEYISSLLDRRRLREAELLQRRYAPSRIDVAGDGTVSWRRVTRLDQPPIRSGSGSGTVLGERQPGASSFVGVHYGSARTDSLTGAKYGEGLKGAEAKRLANSEDPRIKKRVYFYVENEGSMPSAERGLGQYVYTQQMDNILAPGEEMSRLFNQSNRDSNLFEAAVVDAGYDGYAIPGQGMMVVLNNDVPVTYEGTRQEIAETIPAPKSAGQFSRAGVQAAANQDRNAPDLFVISMTPTVLNAVGGQNQPFIMQPQNVVKIVNPAFVGKGIQEDSVRRNSAGMVVPVARRIALTVDELRRIPYLIADPVAVINQEKTATRREGYMVITDMQKDGYPVVAVVHPNIRQRDKDGEISLVSELVTVYPANDSFTLQNINRELNGKQVLYFNKGKAIALTAKIGTKLPSLSKVTPPTAKNPGTVPQRTLPKVELGNFSRVMSPVSEEDGVIRVNGREYQSRLPDEPYTKEGTKKYMKRAIDTLPSPQELPFAPDRFFATTAKTQMIPLDKIVSSKTEEENQKGGSNAPKRFLAAYDGILQPREPIAIESNGDGTYTVIDGNGTLTAFKQYGWQEIPADVYENVQAFEEREKEIKSAPKYKAYTIPDVTRRMLAKRFPPTHERVILDHITATNEDAATPSRGEVIGVSDNNGIQSLVVRVNGKERRSDGVRYHISISANNEARTGDAGVVIENGFTKVSPPIPFSLPNGADYSAPMSGFARRVPIQGSRFTLPARTIREKFVENLFENRMSRVEDVQQAVEQQGGTLDITDRSGTVVGSTDISSATSRMRGAVRGRLDRFTKEVEQPLIEQAARLRVNLEDVAQYLYATYAPERNAIIQQRNPTQFATDGGSGMTNAEAVQIVSAFRTRADFANIQRIANGFRRITNMTQDILLNEGLIEPSIIAQWRAENPNYVPLRGFEQIDETTGNPLGVGSPGRLDARNPFVRTAKGRESRAGQILENILKDYSDTVVLAEKNNVNRLFLQFVRSNPDNDLWQVNAPKISRSYYKGGMTPLGYAQGNVRIAYEVNEDPSQTIAVRVAGRPVFIKVKDPGVLEDMQMAGAFGGGEQTKLYLKAWSGTMSLLAKLRTTLSPAFITIDAIRNVETGGFWNLVKYGPKTAVRSYAKLFRAARTAWAAERDPNWAGGNQIVTIRLPGTAPTNVTVRQLYDWYRADGGKVGYLDIKQIEDIQNDIQRRFRAAMVAGSMDPRTYHTQAIGLVGKAEDLLLDAAGSVETSMRFATYMSRLEAGSTRQEATDAAKNVTVNFDRKGKWTPHLGLLYMFANANVQGSRATYNMIFKSGWKGAALGGSLMALGYAIAQMAAGMAGDDDEPYWDKQLYKQGKFKSLLFFTPDGNTVTIPMPYGSGFFVNIGYALSDLQRGVPLAKVGSFLRDSFFTHFSPLGPAENVGTFVSPTLLDPLVVAATNKNEMGMPLMPESTFQPGQPDSEKFWASTRGTMFQEFSRWMNEATGGTQGYSGAVDVSPETLRYWANVATGGAGSFVRDTADSLMLSTEIGLDNALDKNKIPFIKSFYQQNTGKQNQIEFYSNSDEAVRALNEWKMMYDSPRRSETAVAERLREQRRMTALGSAVVEYKSALSALRFQEVKVVERRTNGDLTKAEAEERLQKIAEKKDRLYTDFNRAFYRADPKTPEGK